MSSPDQTPAVALSVPDSQDAALATCVFFIVLVVAIFQALKEWPEKHRRAQLLKAYRRRHSWKKGDLPRLRALGVNKWAERRMQRVVGRGRPVVQKPTSPLEEIEGKLTDIRLLIDPNAPSIRRRRALRNWPCWPEYVEALYRGEHFRAKARGVKGPSEEAERFVGESLGMSAAAVRKTCGAVRRHRASHPNAVAIPAMTLEEFDASLESDSSFSFLSPAKAVG